MCFDKCTASVHVLGTCAGRQPEFVRSPIEEPHTEASKTLRHGTLRAIMPLGDFAQRLLTAVPSQDSSKKKPACGA